MTDWEHISSIIERLESAVRELSDLVDRPGGEFPEALRRWKDRIVQFVERHVATEEAERFRSLSTSWDSLFPESFVAMIERHIGFLRVLGEEIEKHPDDMILLGYAEPPESPRTVPAKLFVSHAASDRLLAEAIRDEILRYLPTVKVFIASRPGHITIGEEWWTRIATELRAADAYVVLLTPDSVDRLWVSFETGAAWLSRRPLLLLAEGIKKAEIPMPLQALQTYYVGDAEELAAAFHEIRIDLEDPTDLAKRLKGLQTLSNGDKSWEGIEREGRYFAWKGPRLHTLEDRAPEPTPPGLVDALRAAGWNPRYSLPRKLGHAIETGAQIVYETDRRTWRRRLWGVEGEQILVIRRMREEPPN